MGGESDGEGGDGEGGDDGEGGGDGEGGSGRGGGGAVDGVGSSAGGDKDSGTVQFFQRRAACCGSAVQMQGQCRGLCRSQCDGRRWWWLCAGAQWQAAKNVSEAARALRQRERS